MSVMNEDNTGDFMSSLEDDNVKIEVLRLLNDNYSYNEISRLLSISNRTISRFAKGETYQHWWATMDKPVAAGSKYDHRANIERLEGRRFIVSSAQNNTYVHSEFLKSLENMARDIDAEIIIGTYSYNTNGFQNLSKGEGEWFDPRIIPYIMDGPAELAEGLIWCGELNILPTAVNPLSGFQSYTKNNSGIVPHAKVQLESLPSHKSLDSRLLYSTGSVTKRNYVQKKAGQKAEFHHVFGALLVEVDSEGDWFVRQLIADNQNGHFYDMDTLYTPDAIHPNQSVEAVTWGDLHSEKGNKDVFFASFDPSNQNNMLSYLKPKYQFVHDVLDMEARNHHNINDPYFLFQKYQEGRDTVQGNIKEVCQTLDKLQRDYSHIVVVESNHDLALKKWLKNSDYKNDPANAIFFLENQLAIYKAIQRGETDFNVLEHAVKTIKPDLNHIKFLKTDESFLICNQNDDGIECGQHSHIGVNGSKGSVTVFQKLGQKHNIGHSHSATIKDGVYQVGLSADLDMGYNEGNSSWNASHCITYPNGKRTMITLKNGKYMASD